MKKLIILPILVVLSCNIEKKEDVKITSTIIYDTLRKGMSSYCHPESYKIVKKSDSTFVVQLPHGTQVAVHKTIQEAQKDINNMALNSRREEGYE